MTEEEPLDPGYRVTVYQYSARREPTGDIGRSGRPRTAYPALSDGALQQLYLVHRMRNELVDVEQEYEASVAEVWKTVPSLASLLDDVAAQQSIIDQLVEKVKAQSAQRRSKEKVDTALKKELATARATLKTLKTAAKAGKAEAFALIQPMLTDLQENKKKLIKEIRQGYASRGLYWGSYNLVLEHHATSVKNLTARRKNGQPAGYRFHAWRREGTLAVQVQRGAGDPPRSPETIASGTGKWRNVVQITPWMPPEEWAALSKQERKQIGRQGVIRIRISTDEHFEIPIMLSRMLPREADITGVQITQRFVADYPEITVGVTARVPKAPVRTEGPAIAVHLGWRSLDNGDIRVATLSSVSKVERHRIPENLRSFVKWRGYWGEVVFPAAWRRDFAYVDELRSSRDTQLEKLKTELVEYLADGGLFSDQEFSAGEVKQWRSVGRFATLALKVRSAKWNDEAAFEQLPEKTRKIINSLIEWYRWDKRTWQREAGTRKRLLRRRTDVYRRVAKWLAQESRVIVVDDMDLTAMARGRANDDQRLTAARANRVLAAPSELRACIRNAAMSYGALLKEIDSKGIGKLVHHACGTTTATEEDYIDKAMIPCATCDKNFDQDANMGRLLLAAVGELPAAGTQQ